MIIDTLKSLKDVVVSEEDNIINVSFITDISNKDLMKAIETIYDIEANNEVTIYTKLKGLNTSSIVEVMKYSLKKEDLSDPLMLLNILNLVKIYNSLDDTFFNDERIYFSSIEDLLDVKLDLHDEIAEFQKQLSIYFISLFKSYNKIMYEPLDKHVKLPNLYRNIIMSTDILTLSGIFSVSKSFSTDDCVFIDDATEYLMELLLKGSISSNLLKMFIGEQENGSSIGNNG